MYAKALTPGKKMLEREEIAVFQFDTYRWELPRPRSEQQLQCQRTAGSWSQERGKHRPLSPKERP
jgi:hypothetical protein